MLNKENKSKYDRKYQKEHMKQISVWINKEKDEDLLIWLNLKRDISTPEYIRQCLRKEMRETLDSDLEQKTAFENAKTVANKK